MRWGLGCLLIVFPSGRLTWSPSGNYVGFLQLTFEKVEVFWEDTYQSLECELNKYKNAYIYVMILALCHCVMMGFMP